MIWIRIKVIEGKSRYLSAYDSCDKRKNHCYFSFRNYFDAILDLINVGLLVDTQQKHIDRIYNIRKEILACFWGAKSVNILNKRPDRTCVFG